MRLALSLYAFTLVTAAVTFSPFKVRDLDDPSDLFTSDESLLLPDNSDSADGSIGEFVDDLGFLDPTSSPLDDSASILPDDSVISNSIDSSCLNPARKRELFDEDPLIGR